MENISKEMQEEMLSECIICVDTLGRDKYITALSCGHVFDTLCIRQYFCVKRASKPKDQEDNCPICSSKVKYTTDIMLKDEPGPSRHDDDDDCKHVREYKILSDTVQLELCHFKLQNPVVAKYMNRLKEKRHKYVRKAKSYEKEMIKMRGMAEQMVLILLEACKINLMSLNHRTFNELRKLFKGANINLPDFIKQMRNTSIDAHQIYAHLNFALTLVEEFEKQNMIKFWLEHKENFKNAQHAIDYWILSKQASVTLPVQPLYNSQEAGLKLTEQQKLALLKISLMRKENGQEMKKRRAEEELMDSEPMPGPSSSSHNSDSLSRVKKPCLMTFPNVSEDPSDDDDD